ncbi:hypothetical protein Lal_00006564 [Lupinus albus]|nr:hypothetical protein Lal_00006564 [Lupinus albus]
MATTIKNISIFLFFLGLISPGYCKPCYLSNLSVKQVKTGVQIDRKPEWIVVIANNCDCPQSQVLLNCRGFKTVKPVDPKIMKYSGTDFCLINDGKPSLDETLSFKYAWDDTFSMSLNSSTIKC